MPDISNNGTGIDSDRSDLKAGRTLCRLVHTWGPTAARQVRTKRRAIVGGGPTADVHARRIGQEPRPQTSTVRQVREHRLQGNCQGHLRRPCIPGLTLLFCASLQPPEIRAHRQRAQRCLQVVHTSAAAGRTGCSQSCLNPHLACPIPVLTMVEGDANHNHVIRGLNPWALTQS